MRLVKRLIIKLLNLQQWGVLLKTLPNYNLAKIKVILMDAISGKMPDIPPYELVTGANKYGDTYVHWAMPRQPFGPEGNTGAYNPKTIEVIAAFNSFVKNELHGKLLVSYPPFPISEVKSNAASISRVTSELKKHNLQVLGTPEDYFYPDPAFFNSPYHLYKQAAVDRTEKLIQEIKNEAVQVKY